jgi:hypothetical protein
VAKPPGFPFGRAAFSGQFGVRRAVRQQRISNQFQVINWGVTDLAGAISANAKSLERSIHIVKRGLYLGNALIIEI